MDRPQIDTKESALSVRIYPDGLYFSLVSHDKNILFEARVERDASTEDIDRLFPDFSFSDKQFMSVEVVNMTDRFALVPRELYTETGKSTWLQTAEGETLFEIDCGNDILLLMPLDNSVAGLLTSFFAENSVVFTHPIVPVLSRGVPKNDTLHILVWDNYSFVVLYASGMLRYAESLPVCDFASLLFVANRLVAANKLDKIRVMCNDSVLTKELGRYFSYTVCE